MASSTIEAMAERIAALTCPIARAEQVTAIAEEWNNLPPVLARLRRDALQEARDAGHAVKDLAEQIPRLKVGRIYQLTVTRRHISSGLPRPHCLPAGQESS